MTPEEKQTLRVAISTISEPASNWHYGWKVICEMAELNPEDHPAPFRGRTDEELEKLTFLRKPLTD